MRNQPALLDITLRFMNCCQQGDLVGYIAKINVIGKPLYCLQNLFLYAHA
jgi:hypothetical protein